MKVRVQRLQSAQSHLPQLYRRFYSIETPITASILEQPPVEITLPAARSTEPENSLLEQGAKQLRDALLESKKLDEKGDKKGRKNGEKKQQKKGEKKEPEVSEIHWALSSLYKLGGKIGEVKSPLERMDLETRIPLWNEAFIPLKVKAFTGEYTMSLPHFWLRDNCRCSKCVNQDTMQRAFDTFSIPHKIKPTEVVTEKEGLRVIWNHEDHVSLYTWDFLLKHRQHVNCGVTDSTSTAYTYKNPYKYWGSGIAKKPPSVSYQEIMANDKGVGKWTQKIREYGFCYVDGCPVSPEKTKKLLERISFIRTTHYGGFYDFTADLTMKDTAYTNLALPAHTDTTYFTDPAGLQMFHLLSHTEGDGGKSLLVDGFKAAQELKRRSLWAYTVLAATGVSWHASGNKGITITPGKPFPVLNYGDVQDVEGQQLMQVRWNNDDRGVVALNRSYGRRRKLSLFAEEWYKAAAIWNSVLKRQDLEYWAQLKPGRPLIFDNWRVLHGRSAFTGKRRICGGYINHDDYISRWRNTNFSREEAIAQIL